MCASAFRLGHGPHLLPKPSLPGKDTWTFREEMPEGGVNHHASGQSRTGSLGQSLATMSAMETAETLAQVLAITRIKKRGLSQPDRVQVLLDSADPREALADIAGPSLLDDPALSQAREDVDNWLSQGMGLVSVLADQYPARLRDVREAPALLYYQGDLTPADQGVCIVGSRDADDDALRVADYVARAAVEAGLTVVSGLAAGIDTAAHTAALDAGGRTVAVMGTGLERTYPATNKNLRERIVANRGLVMTQFEPNAPVKPANFPMRNAVMSGYGITTFVVTASRHSLPDEERSQTRTRNRSRSPRSRDHLLGTGSCSHRPGARC